MASAEPNQASRKELDLEDLLQEKNSDLSIISNNERKKICFEENKNRNNEKVNMEVTIEYIKNLKKLYGPKISEKEDG